MNGQKIIDDAKDRFMSEAKSALFQTIDPEFTADALIEVRADLSTATIRRVIRFLTTTLQDREDG